MYEYKNDFNISDALLYHVMYETYYSKIIVRFCTLYISKIVLVVAFKIISVFYFFQNIVMLMTGIISSMNPMNLNKSENNVQCTLVYVFVFIIAHALIYRYIVYHILFNNRDNYKTKYIVINSVDLSNCNKSIILFVFLLEKRCTILFSR